MQDSEADRIINWVNSLDAKNRQVLEDVRSIVRDIVADTNKVRVEGGLIPEDFNTGQVDVNEQGEKVAAPTFQEYVPLRGILDPEGEASEDGSFGAARGQTFSIRGRKTGACLADTSMQPAYLPAHSCKIRMLLSGQRRMQ